MNEVPDNPFQSPRELDFEEADASELVLGRTVTNGYSYLTFGFVAFTTFIGIFLVALSGLGMVKVHPVGITLMAIVLITVGAVVHFVAVYSGKLAPLLVDQTRLFGCFSVGKQTEEMEVAWSDLVFYKFDGQGYLQLEAKDGVIYTIYVGWYPEHEQEQLQAFCCDQMLNTKTERPSTCE